MEGNQCQLAASFEQDACENMSQTQRIALKLLSWALIDKNEERDDTIVKQNNLCNIDWNSVYDLYNKHAITSLVYNIIPFIPTNYSKLKNVWKAEMYLDVYNYSHIVNQMNDLLKSFRNRQIPVVVVKGTSAAKYYPEPRLRAMGDIDFLVKPDYYDQAIKCLKELGCIETTSQIDSEMGRHRSFHYNNVSIELHHFFSLYVDEEKANALDTMLFNAISIESSVLPDEENGMVILSHIRQHMKSGIGLRQIIDWMMFVRSYLNDAAWCSSFQGKAKKIGLEQLAIIVTRMCQKYLGLKKTGISWCDKANDEVCDVLMQYILESGNFGRARDSLQTVGVALPTVFHPIQFFKYIQTHGEHNWTVLEKHSYLKPFSWIYQLCRCVNLLVQNKVGVKKLNSIYIEGQKLNELYTALEI